MMAMTYSHSGLKSDLSLQQAYELNQNVQTNSMEQQGNFSLMQGPNGNHLNYSNQNRGYTMDLGPQAHNINTNMYSNGYSTSQSPQSFQGSTALNHPPVTMMAQPSNDHNGPTSSYQNYHPMMYTQDPNQPTMNIPIQNGNRLQVLYPGTMMSTGLIEPGKPPRRGGGGRKRKPTENMDPKKIQFLERNREAALKCRLRKKKNQETVMLKLQLLNQQNQQLDMQAHGLNNHIQELRNLLNTHQFCPVFMANSGLTSNPPGSFSDYQSNQ